MFKSERLVKEKLPKAKCETQRSGYKTYYLIRNDRDYLYIASGSTKKEAWDKAMDILGIKSPLSKTQRQKEAKRAEKLLKDFIGFNNFMNGGK